MDAAWLIGVIGAIGTTVGTLLGRYWQNKRKDQTLTEKTYERLFKKQEDQIDRYALTIGTHAKAIRSLYAMLVRTARASDDCHRSHRLMVEVLQEYHGKLEAAGLNPRPLPDFPDMESTRQDGIDRNDAEFIIRAAEHELSMLAEVDKQRKRDSDHVDTGDPATRRQHDGP